MRIEKLTNEKIKIMLSKEDISKVDLSIHDFLADKDIDKDKKGFDPRKLLKPGAEAIKNKTIELMKQFGSYQKAE